MHVLVLDDHDGIRLLLEKILKQYGHSASVFSNGADALEALVSGENKYDLIISDYHLPNFDGMEFCQEVKNIESLADLPFIFITSETSELVEAQAKKLGAVSFVRKPIDARALVTLMDALH
jgi:CheY-like chemotaxis protein